MMNGFNGMVWGMGFGWVFGLLVLVAIIWLIVRMVSPNPESPDSTNTSALDILNERYANGEINKQEYEEKKRAIL